MAGYGSAEYYLHHIYEILKNGETEQPVQPVPPDTPEPPIPSISEKRAVLHKYTVEKTKSVVYTVSDTVPAGEQWVILAASCWVDRLIESISFGVRDKGGHITTLARSEDIDGYALSWTGEMIVQEKEAVVMVIENKIGNPLAQAKMTYRGYYE